MSFVNAQQQTNRPGAAIAVIGIHAVLGVGIVLGLSGAVQVITEDRPIGTFKVDPVAPPPPPPPPKQQPDAKAKATESTVYTPPVPQPFPRPGPAIGSTTAPKHTVDVAPYAEPTGGGLGRGIEPLPSVAIVDAIGVSPRNDSSRWVRGSDYRTRWRREDMAGAASYRLGVGTDGRVQDCTITRSSGHSALDQATCNLVTKRARFNPARNSADEQVAGSYSGSVLWQIPD